MISPISFGSTYKVKIDNIKQNEQSNAHFATLQFCNRNEIDYASVITKNIEKSPNQTYSQLGITTTIVAKDEDDEKIENFFKEQNIQYTQYLSSIYMNPYMVISRLEPAPKNYKIKMVDVKKLERLIKKQPSNSYEWLKEDYEKNGKAKANFILRSQDKFKTAMLFLTPLNEDNGLIEDLKTSKIKTPPKDSIYIDIVQPSEIPDANMFFAMKNAGFTQIPVYVDKETQELGQLLNIFNK